MTRHLASVPDAPRRMVAYVRVSALMGRGGETFHSPELQVQAIKALAARTGATVVEVVQDIDVSGRGFAREGLDRVLALARAKDVDCVGLYDLSRLGRNTGEALRCIATLRELGVSIASTVEQIDDSPEGQFMLGQFLGMAQLYSDQIGRRWQQVIDKRARAGLWHGSAPMGYQLPPGGSEPRVLEPHPDLAPLIADTFRRYAQGERILHLARDLGMRRGRPMVTSVLREVLGNPVYVGKIRAGGVVLEGRHEAIVDPTTWEAVQRRLQADARTPSRRLAVAHSLVSLVRCEGCGGHLQQHARSRGDAVLRCTGAQAHGVCPGIGAPRTRDVEAIVLEAVRAMLVDLQVDPATAAHQAARRAITSAELQELRRDLRESEEALARAGGLLARGVMSEQAYAVTAANLENAIGVLRSRISDLEVVSNAPRGKQAIRRGTALLDAWDSLTVDERNRGLRALLSEVRIRRAAARGEPLSHRIRCVPLA